MHDIDNNDLLMVYVEKKVEHLAGVLRETDGVITVNGSISTINQIYTI